MKEEKEYQLTKAENGKYEFKKINGAINLVSRPTDS